jgi:hypothetical protein
LRRPRSDVLCKHPSKGTSLGSFVGSRDGRAPPEGARFFVSGAACYSSSWRSRHVNSALARTGAVGLIIIDSVAALIPKKRAELRVRGLLDEQNKLTRRGRIVQGCL